jgi:hypothetical protein
VIEALVLIEFELDLWCTVVQTGRLAVRIVSVGPEYADGHTTTIPLVVMHNAVNVAATVTAVGVAVLRTEGPVLARFGRG